MCFHYRKKHKKHKHKKSKSIDENLNGNGAVIDKIVSQLVSRREINGRISNTQPETEDTEDSDDDKLIDLDSDEVDCTIIEDDIDLEELMKQKVSFVQYFTNASLIFGSYVKVTYRMYQTLVSYINT